MSEGSGAGPKAIETNGRDGFLRCGPRFPEFDFYTGADKAGISASPGERPQRWCLQIKERFAKIPLKTAFRLQGGYAIRWYEMCQSKAYLGTFTMSVEELRAWLNIEEHELRPVKDLHQRAIDVAQAELDKKADLTFTYKPTKTGRRITGWIFKVKKNQPRPVQRQLPLRGLEPERTPEEKAKNLELIKGWKRDQKNGTARSKSASVIPPERCFPSSKEAERMR